MMSPDKKSRSAAAASTEATPHHLHRTAPSGAPPSGRRPAGAGRREGGRRGGVPEGRVEGACRVCREGRGGSLDGGRGKGAECAQRRARPPARAPAGLRNVSVRGPTGQTSGSHRRTVPAQSGQQDPIRTAGSIRGRRDLMRGLSQRRTHGEGKAAGGGRHGLMHSPPWLRPRGSPPAGPGESSRQ